MKMTTKVSLLFTWHICQIIVDCLSLIVTTYILNQFRGHWLLNDTFNSIIFINLKLRTKHENVPSFQTVMEEDFSVALQLI